MVSTAVSYTLLILFGIFGFHHFYLRRYRHGFVWLCTLGGFGFGWLRDFFKLTTYIQECRKDEEDTIMTEKEEENETTIQAALKKTNGKKTEDGDVDGTISEPSITSRRKEAEKKPPESSWTRNTGQVVFAAILNVTFLSAIPEELLEDPFAENIANMGAAVFTAIGVHTVGNIGRHSTSFRWCLWPSILAHLLCPAASNTSLYAIVFVVFVAERKGKSWRARKRGRPKGRVKPLLAVALSFACYMALWGSGLWFNTYLTTNDGERVKLKDAVENFFNSPAWTEMLDTMWHLYEYTKHHGFANLYREFIAALDPEGETNAYKVLGLSSSADAETIKKTCRILSRQYHPDKAHGEEAKEKAGQKFIEVQSACQVLDKLRARRAKNSASSIEL